MTRFIYEAVDTAGFAREGILNANSREEAVSQLFADKLTPVMLAVEKSGVGHARLVSHKLKQSDLVAFVRELATLLSSGVGLTESFATLHEATGNTVLPRPCQSPGQGGVDWYQDLSVVVNRRVFDWQG